MGAFSLLLCSYSFAMGRCSRVSNVSDVQKTRRYMGFFGVCEQNEKFISIHKFPLDCSFYFYYSSFLVMMWKTR